LNLVIGSPEFCQLGIVSLEFPASAAEIRSQSSKLKIYILTGTVAGIEANVAVDQEYEIRWQKAISLISFRRGY
jgi:hypothetical protein